MAPNASAQSSVVSENGYKATQKVPADSRQPCSDLNALLVALDQNLAEQGVVVEPKGCCAACSKPIVGQVRHCL